MADGTEVIIKWLPGDVATLRPSWTAEQCDVALSNIGSHLQDRSIELGWEVMEDLLNME